MRMNAKARSPDREFISSLIVEEMTKSASLPPGGRVLCLDTIAALEGQLCFVKASDVSMDGDSVYADDVSTFAGLRLSEDGFEVGLIGAFLLKQGHTNVPTYSFKLETQSLKKAADIIIQFLYDNVLPHQNTVH